MKIKHSFAFSREALSGIKWVLWEGCFFVDFNPFVAETSATSARQRAALFDIDKGDTWGI